MAGQQQARKAGPGKASPVRASPTSATARGTSGKSSAGKSSAGKSSAGKSGPGQSTPVRSTKAAPAAAAPAAPPPAAPASGWRQFTPGAMGGLPFATLVLSVLGVIVAAYLTYTHFAQVAPAACPTSGFENCQAVTTSPESDLFGVLPVSVTGLAFFLFLLAANSPWAWLSPRREVHLVRLAAMVAGILMVLYLVYTELVTLHEICLYCTSVHIITFLLFVLVVFEASAPDSALRRRS